MVLSAAVSSCGGAFRSGDVESRVNTRLAVTSDNARHRWGRGCDSGPKIRGVHKTMTYSDRLLPNLHSLVELWSSNANTPGSQVAFTNQD
jgi:hypothetical protein